MNAKQYRATLDALGLSQQDAGRLVGVDTRTSRRWALDENEREVPNPVAILFRLLKAGKVKLADVEKARDGKL